MAATTEERIEELRNRKKQLNEQINEQIRRLRAKESAKARKARTHRLIEVGAILEQATGDEYPTEERRAALSKALNETVSVYDPEQGGNIDMTIGQLIAAKTPEPEEQQPQTEPETDDKPATDGNDGEQRQEFPPSYPPMGY